MYKLFVILLFLCCFKGTIVAQELHFLTKQIKIGTMSEDDEPRTFNFQYINETNKDIAIKKVETTCGCAQPHYKKGTIHPNEKGQVSVTFYPMGRAGDVKKSIFIHTDTLKEHTPIQLILTGKVTPTTDPYINYPYVIGPLRLMQTTVHFNKVRAKQRQMVSIEVVNSGTDTLCLSTSGLPPYVSFSTIPARIAPQEQADLTFIIHPDKIKQNGTFLCDFLLEGAGNLPEIQKTMTIKGNKE